MRKKFTRNIENFSCINCTYSVSGNGYTNHCPNCFYSIHVDINPGDRKADCLGLMKPIEYAKHPKKEIEITHQCQKCGIIKKNKISADDNLDNLLKIT